MKTKRTNLTRAMLMPLTALFLYSCEGVGVDIPPCTIPVNIEVISKWNSLIGENSGGFVVEATRGNGSYEYSLNEGPFGTDRAFDDLPAGVYTVEVRDREGCSNMVSVTLEEVEIPSFANDIMPIIQTRCAVSFAFCHLGEALRLPLELTNYSQVSANAVSIRHRVADRSMPPLSNQNARALSDSQLSAIINWIDGGALDN